MSNWSHKSYWFYAAAIAAVVVFALPVQAGLVPCTGVTCSFCDLFKLLGNIFDFVVKTITPIVATGFLIYGGFRFITAAGNPTAISAARKILFNTLIGVVIVYASFVLASGLVAALAGQTGGDKFGFNGTSFTFVCSGKGPTDVTGGFAAGGALTITLEDEEPAVIDPASVKPANVLGGDRAFSADAGVNFNSLGSPAWGGLIAASNSQTLKDEKIQLHVTSAFRSVAKQWDIVRDQCQQPIEVGGKCTAKPGQKIACVPKDANGSNCPHVSGRAIDVWGWQNGRQCGETSACQNTVISVMRSQGFCVLKLPNPEPWHFEKPSRNDANCN